MKKLVSLILIVVLTAGMTTVASAQSEEPAAERRAYLSLERPLRVYEATEEERETIKQLQGEIRELRETIKEQHEILKEKSARINELKKDAMQNGDWETLKTIREYRRVNIRIKISILELRYERMDIFDLLDEARRNQDVQMYIEGLEQLIENIRGVVELNGQAIANADACIEEISQ
jgi:TolA-binding protein